MQHIIKLNPTSSFPVFLGIFYSVFLIFTMNDPDEKIKAFFLQILLCDMFFWQRSRQFVSAMTWGIKGSLDQHSTAPLSVFSAAGVFQSIRDLVQTSSTPNVIAVSLISKATLRSRKLGNLTLWSASYLTWICTRFKQCHFKWVKIIKNLSLGICVSFWINRHFSSKYIWIIEKTPSSIYLKNRKGTI